MPIRTTSVAALVAVLASAALLVTGCGSKKSAATTTTTTSVSVTWADGVCTAVKTYNASLTDAEGALMQDLSAAGVEQFATDAKTATNAFVTDLKGLGRPDTASGQQAKQVVDSLTAQLTADLKTVQDATGTSALTAAQTISATVAAGESQIAAAYAELKSLDAQGELSKAFAQAPSCATLAG